MISFPAAFAIVSTVAVLTGKAVSSPVKYDQRQEGDLNVRTDVEDVVFVVVPPKDLITAGMGLVAATAADLLRKNYGGIAGERWPQRTSSKLGFVPLEKSPYKIDLERSEVQVKKISQAGDPNRYNIHEGKLPVKFVQEAVETTSSAPVQQSTETPVVTVTEKLDQIMSTTEGKIVKKDLNSGLNEEEKEMNKEIMKKEDIQMANTDAKSEMNSKPEMNMKKTETKVQKKSKPETNMKTPDTKLEKIVKPEGDMKKPETISEKKSKPEMNMKTPDVKVEKTSKPETDMKKSDLLSENKSKPVESEMKKTEETRPQETLMVIGDFSEDPESIFRREGCGPDGYRDSTGKCVIKTTEKGSK